ncbi:MAG: hypothetical protein ACI90V_000814 [Bacillariaceae sp.]|jgi:hypothetical protein
MTHRKSKKSTVYKMNRNELRKKGKTKPFNMYNNNTCRPSYLAETSPLPLKQENEKRKKKKVTHR